MRSGSLCRGALVVVLAFASLCADADGERPSTRPLRYFNVVPIHDGNVEFAAKEVRRQAALGVKAVAVSLSYHPQCTPARNLLPVHAANFRRLKALLADTGVEVGVLVQSTAGHGWNGKMALSNEPWQHAVHVDGKTNPRYCQLDAGFRGYVLEAVRTIAKEGPSFLLFDDDYGPRNGEGFCPLHVALYNRATGQNRTAEEWRDLAKEGALEDPARRRMEEVRRQVPIAFAREIRAAVDSVDPKIRCGMCTPAKGVGFTRDVALALAGPDTRPFIRICNATYGMQHASCFHSQRQWVRQIRARFEGVDEVVAEADTWPQNHWSESARMFGTHLVFDILLGLDGAKLWMSEFERPLDTGSQTRYERVFADGLAKRQALYDLVRGRGAKFHGVTAPVNSGDWASDSVRFGAIGEGSPITSVFSPMGFPCEVAEIGDGDPEKVWVLTRNSVKMMSDDEIRTVLARRVYVDSIGAKELTKRGFAPLLGVEATDGDDGFFFNKEVPCDGQAPLKIMWDGTMARLKPLSDEVETLSEFAYRDPFMTADAKKGPALTLFRNARGGLVAVAGWTFDCQGWNCWAKYLRVVRKEQLVKVMDRLAGGELPFVACENNHALSSWATLDDGSTLVAFTNLGEDDWRDLRVRLTRHPLAAELLQDDGTWKTVRADKTATNEIAFRVGLVRPLEPQVLRLTFAADEKPFGAGYRRLWTDRLYADIDARIEKYRKAGFAADGFPAGAAVEVRQVKSDFQVGCNMFNFGQLGKSEWDAQYRATWEKGGIFNAATIPFYWANFEHERGKPRYVSTEEDDPAVWAAFRRGRDYRPVEHWTAACPWAWRRPAPDRLIAFCQKNGIDMHGHCIIYPAWDPDWIKPIAARDLNELQACYDKRVKDIACHYKDTLQQWDVVNENWNRQSGTENPNDWLCVHDGLWGRRVLVPKDYTFKALKVAEKYFPKNVKVCVNDAAQDGYFALAHQLDRRGARFDVVGFQMHMFEDLPALKTAYGIDCEPNGMHWDPNYQTNVFAKIDRLGRPIHLSEVTIPSPRNLLPTDEADAIQARLVRDNFRLWFSWPSIYRITYWNLVDGTGAEILASGFYDKDLVKKPVYEAVDRLVNHEWRTNLKLVADKDGKIAFRGFKGEYELVYKDKDGKETVRKETVR